MAHNPGLVTLSSGQPNIVDGVFVAEDPLRLGESVISGGAGLSGDHRDNGISTVATAMPAVEISPSHPSGSASGRNPLPAFAPSRGGIVV